jgi:hypothetical protein
MYINRPDLFVDIPPFIMGYTNLLLTSLHLLYPVACSLYLTLSTPYFSSFAPSSTLLFTRFISRQIEVVIITDNCLSLNISLWLVIPLVIPFSDLRSTL